MLTFAGFKKRKAPHLTVLSSPSGSATEDPGKILEKYREDVGHIDAYANTITPIQFTIYGKTPEWYNDDFKEKFVKAKTDAQLWLNDISSRLISVPECIVDYDLLYSVKSESIVEYCNVLMGSAPADKKRD